jgi:hypothetical protein
MNNKINDMDEIYKLKKCFCLRTLDITGNPVTQLKDYRENILEHVE